MPEPERMGAIAIPIHERLPEAPGLVGRARKGDFTAYEQLYHRHVGRIYGICLRMTANRDEAEDMTQQTFIRAWERLDTFRGEAGFAAWLRRIAVNMVLSDRRSPRHRAEKTVEDIQLVEAHRPLAPVASRNPLDLERAIERLPERARMVFVLHDVEGYRHDEIATLLDIATGTSKAQLHRARKLLRKVLAS
jgi:RNA polymerase sigma-70 factor (ECF subfamily)